MKLRIKGNSIRLRLGQSEVRQLMAEGRVEEFTDFGPSKEQQFGYALHATFEDANVIAGYADNRMVVRVPVEVIHQWAETDQVSIHARQRTSNKGELRILIEKDFECIDAPSDEPQEDAFPNPHVSASCAPATNE